MAKAKKTTTQKASTPAPSEEVKTYKPAPKRRRRKKVLALCFIILLLALLVGLAWEYKKTKDELKRQNNPAEAVQTESQDTVAEVKKIMILPDGELPTVANVSDASKLQDKPFFENAQNGDKVLIYQKSQKAILYRPPTKQIVNVATYTEGETPATQP